MSEIDTSVWYQPQIGPRLKPVFRSVFRQWSGMEDADLAPHLYRIRDQAWPLGNYPCIGLWMFLMPGIANFPNFPLILETAKRCQAVILDLGCGLGQHLRLLAAHGVPTECMWGLDSEAELWNIGYDLFRDHGRMEAGFIHADFLKINLPTDERLRSLRGQVDLILACQFLHLFDWDGQIAAGKQIVGLSKPGTLFVGFQQGRQRSRAYIRPWGMMYYHNKASFMQLWDIVEQQTGTSWKIEATEVALQDWGMQDEDVKWMPDDHMGINFSMTREK